MSEIVEEIALDSDYQGLVKMTRRNIATGRREKAAGLSGVEMYFSLTEGGAAINAAVRWTLLELSGNLGWYSGVLDTAAVTTYLKPLGVGATVWKAIVKPDDVVDWRPCRLVWRRPD